MFNLKKQAKSPIKSTEKYLRDESHAATNDGKEILQKTLGEQKTEIDEITEKQIDEKHTVAESDNVIIEKAFDRVKGYLPHRRNDAWLSVPPIAAVVEKLQKERMKDWKEEKSHHWTTEKSSQNGKLPAWPKGPAQHDKIVLNNDPRRFDSLKDFPPKATDSYKTQSEKITDVEPLVGKITKADIHQVADRIKTGASVQFDSAIVTILRNANSESRELTPSEREAIQELKIARTESLLNEINRQ